MNEIQIFNSNEFGQVRTVCINGETYFVGKDVAEALGYAEPRSAVSKRVEEEDKGVAKIETPSGIQEMTVITESGLYALIFGSKLESAKRFKHWVTSEVLPAIRKNGSYQLTGLSPQLQLMQNMVNQMAQQELEIKRANEKSDRAIETVNRMKDEILAPLGDWRRDVNEKVRTIAYYSNIPYQNIFDEMYSKLEVRAHCNLETLKRNKIARMEKAGQTKSCIKNETTKLAVIEGNDRLREIFSSIVREYAAKYLA